MELTDSSRVILWRVSVTGELTSVDVEVGDDVPI